MNIVIKKSSQPDKKFTAVIDNKKQVHFGGIKENGKPYSDFTQHRDEERKNRYLQRHKKDHFNNPLYPSFYSTNLLWNKKTLSESIKDTNRKYNVNIKIQK